MGLNQQHYERVEGLKSRPYYSMTLVSGCIRIVSGVRASMF